MMLQRGTILAPPLIGVNGLDVSPTILVNVYVTDPTDFKQCEYLPGFGKDDRPNVGDSVYFLPLYSDEGNQVVMSSYGLKVQDTLMLPGDSDIHGNLAGAKVSQVKTASNGLVTIKNQSQNLNTTVLSIILTALTTDPALSGATKTAATTALQNLNLLLSIT